MVVGARTERPAELPFGFLNRMFVDASEAHRHEPFGSELPVLIGTKPLAAVVMVFVGEAVGDAVGCEGPELLDEPIIELARPFADEERFDLDTATQVDCSGTPSCAVARSCDAAVVRDS
jgi:hypothetical protein